MKLLFIGDVFGDSGIKAVEAYLRENRDAQGFDIVAANAENASAWGAGLSKKAAAALFDAGVDVITLGNHTFKNPDIYAVFKEYEHIIRPVNFPEGAPGKGSTLFYTARGAVGLVNVMGRLYLDTYDCPFLAAEREIIKLRERTNIIMFDIHGEATSEKRALAYCLDGRCSLVAGTHTHVQTADEHIMPGGTGFITDVGMTGPADGVIGVKKEAAIRRFRSLLPERFTPAEGRRQFNAIIADIDEESGETTALSRVNQISGEVEADEK